ncbi:Pkinase-domain-containing protein [Delitschia confertaspora ATCC 74209]|uniref:non-specific serine/threonine protein kinase n=1 Tax=Delitschia confertaspora ATCC 74209 TaxID=1513339 RepID=A0A9P4JLE0_9PLEO|nr:Pkinase-domain-containing protein [Delitschia confertaspora ATCC 74209]
MSSAAAVQASGPAISTRAYQPPQSTNGRDQFYSQQSPTITASPSSSQKPSRRPSGNGASPNTPTSLQTHHSPTVSSTSNVNTPRAQPLPPSTFSPPAAASLASAAPMPPPRTSSHRHQSSTATSGAQEKQRSEARKTEQSSSQDSPRQQGGRSRPPATQPFHSRSATAIGQPPIGTDLPREESTVINRIVVADPQEDIARAQARQAEARNEVTPITGLGLVGGEGVDDGGRGTGKSRQDHSKSESSGKRSRFGNYILGQTLGEGEFGKVKMGWKKDSSVEVAIKLIRRETLGSNQNRLTKIYREISILRGLDHPNIVRLHEMVETERHIGIILEYASGGELFDYILNHRYLKDNAARRLFAQLISGVGYLHKKGIVHRDLKLENLLLDRNRNIIITDFGFANTFDPNDELGEEIEYSLGDKDFVRRMGLEGSDGARRGDLMKTSCGSPCYAAPELVVSDSLYTGRKVDVWSCGVILYAMLAGYLPFDDDPANPEGDNINLLYQYIVSTPLTFPEYVTPHARDLLKRILVPDPRKRADLFEVARHSWLSEYASVVGFITSSTTTSSDASRTTVPSKNPLEAPTLARSASVREPAKPHTTVSQLGGLGTKHGQINKDEQAEKSKATRDTKRRTVQVEYVAPHSQTARGEASPTAAAGSSKSRVKESEPTAVRPANGYQPTATNGRTQTRPSGVPASSTQPTRPARDAARSVSDYTTFGAMPSTSTTVRPSTQGTLGGGSRLPSRGNSYGQPVAATVAQTNAEGRFSQPKGKQYSISGPMSQLEPAMGELSIGQPSTQRMPEAQTAEIQSGGHKSHRRSNTVSETFGRMTSIFSSRPPHDSNQHPSSQGPNRIQKSYPPTSMPVPIANDEPPRQSIESSRRTSFGFNRKNSEQGAGGKSSRRFTLLPASLSKTFSSQHRDSAPPPTSYSASDARRSAAQVPPRSRGQSRPGMESRSPSQSTTGSRAPGFYDGPAERAHGSNSRTRDARGAPSSAPAPQTQFDYAPPIGDEKIPGPTVPHPASQGYRDRAYHHPNDSESSGPSIPQQQRPQYPVGFNSSDSAPSQGRERPGVLQKSRKFADAYEDPKQGHHSGSSGSAKRVMDLFRRLGRQRGKEDR